MKTTLWILTAAAVVAALAYPKIKPLLNTSATASSDAAQTRPARAPTESRPRGPGALPVSTFVVEATPFAETIAATGTLRAYEGLELQAESSGRVISLHFAEGTPVRQGDLLVKLNDAELRANLQRYKHSKRLAEVRYKRIAQLLAQQVVTQDDYDSALSEMHVQQAYIDLYSAQIDKTEIRAPFDGVVGLRYISVGTLVTATTPIATLQRLDQLKIDFAIPERYVGRVRMGSEIQFTTASGLQAYRGTVYAMDPKIDPHTRTLLVRAITEGHHSQLLPGAFVQVSLPLEQFPDAFFIPAEAVIPGLENKNVFVVSQGVAEPRAVETGTRTAAMVQIVSGLHAGDRVITSGLQQLRAYQPVEPLADPRRVREASLDAQSTEGPAQDTEAQDAPRAML